MFFQRGGFRKRIDAYLDGEFSFTSAFQESMRKVLLVLGIPVVIGALCVLGLHLYFSSGSFRELVEQEVELALNREVSIAVIDLSVVRSFPELSVRLENVDVQDAETGRTLMEIPETEVGVSLKALLNESLVCGITIQNPQIIVEAYADGTSNLSDLISEEWLNGSDESSFQTVVLTGFDVVDAEVRYRNAGGREIGILGMESRLQAYMAEDSTAFTGTMQTTAVHLGAWERGVRKELPSLMNIALGAGSEAAEIRFAEAKLAVGAYELDLTGLPIDWNSVPRVVDLAVRLQALGEAPEAQVDALLAEAEQAAQTLIANERERLRNRLDEALQEGADRLKNRIGRILGGNGG